LGITGGNRHQIMKRCYCRLQSTSADGMAIRRRRLCTARSSPTSYGHLSFFLGTLEAWSPPPHIDSLATTRHFSPPFSTGM
jgi:hypothetical protein